MAMLANRPPEGPQLTAEALDGPDPYDCAERSASRIVQRAFQVGADQSKSERTLLTKVESRPASEPGQVPPLDRSAPASDSSIRTLRISWRRLAAESIAIVASILLAFAIDAWWQARSERNQIRAELAAFLGELRTNQRIVDDRLAYHIGIRDATAALLSLAGAAGSTVSTDSLDHLFADASWWGGADAIEMAVLDALVVGGTLADVDDSELVRALTKWRQGVERLQLAGLQDYQASVEVWMPFMRRNAYLPQISNATRRRPGSAEPIHDYAVIPAAAEVFDHSRLLRSIEFQNVLVQKKWAQEDFVREYASLTRQLEALAPLVEAAVR
jgi:hypothetical protein